MAAIYRGCFSDSKGNAYYPATDAESVKVGAATLESLCASQLPDTQFVSITHDLNGYPLVLLLAYQYGAGIGGAGTGPAGGTNPLQFPCRAEYINRNKLTLYVPKAIANLGSSRTLNKVSAYEYTVTFSTGSADSLYVKLILNMGLERMDNEG